MQPKHPDIGLFPALPLEKKIELRSWMIGTPDDETPWRSQRFKELVAQLLDSFAKNDSGDRFEGGALLWHRGSGFDGSRPTPEECRAIQAAVRFAALDWNDQVRRGDPNGFYSFVTSENAALHVQPIDEEQGYITHFRDGILKRLSAGGWKIGERPPPLADATFPILSPIPVSGKLTNAIFEAHMAPNNEGLRRLCIAVEWHAVALSNPVAVTMQQRLIALKTGFEALLGTSDSRDGARRLRALFETAAKPHYALLPSPNMLWCPRERADLPRQWKKKLDPRSELEDWFMALQEARNTIIHEGRVPDDLDYHAPKERPLSRYAGPLFWTGERVLREAIKATLGPEILLCGPLKQQARLQPLYDMLSAQDAEGERTPLTDGSATPTATGRHLSHLLEELGCETANQVQLGRSFPQGSPDTSEMPATSSWVAKTGGKEIWISDAEKAVLEQAGAEEELPDDITLCD